MRYSFSTVLFDLDGTLLDTSKDLMNALNHVLTEHGRDTVTMEPFRQTISHGTPAMLSLGFQIKPNDPMIPTYRQQLLDHYVAHLTDHTKFFPGMERALNIIEQRQALWGIVSNKPEELTLQVAKNLSLNSRCACIIGGDTLPKKKPEPDQLLMAAKMVNSPCKHIIYVGDAESDIIAARRAGMFPVAVRYGFHPDNSPIDDWGANIIFDTANHLADWLEQQILGADHHAKI